MHRFIAVVLQLKQRFDLAWFFSTVCISVVFETTFLILPTGLVEESLKSKVTWTLFWPEPERT